MKSTRTGDNEINEDRRSQTKSTQHSRQKAPKNGSRETCLVVVVVSGGNVDVVFAVVVVVVDVDVVVVVKSFDVVGVIDFRS